LNVYERLDWYRQIVKGGMNEVNRKRFVIFTLLFVFIILLLFSRISVEETDAEADTSFMLPSSLLIIEDEAFEGVAAQTVIFPKGLLSIGKGAFGNDYSLKDVYIPDSTEYIDDSAFSINSNLTIHGIDGSYTKDWAYKHEIPFVIDDVWTVFAPSGGSSNTLHHPVNRPIATIVLVILFELFSLNYFEIRSRRPQDCPELHPINYRFP